MSRERESCILRFDRIWAAVSKTKRNVEGLTQPLRKLKRRE